MKKEHLEVLLQNKNVQAFLMMIRHCEGTASENGYRYLFGSRPGKENLCPNFIDHPKKFFPYTDKAGKKIQTSAAGAYQITYTTWKSLKAILGLQDFTPKSQDIAALELIAECKAIPDIEKGCVSCAIKKVKNIWASLPGSGNNQPEKSIAQAKLWYQQAGGVLV